MKDKILGIYFSAILVGVFVGALASLFILAIHGLSFQLEQYYSSMHQSGWLVACLSGLVSVIMILIAWLLVKFFAPEAAGSGIPEIEGALSSQRPIYWRRLLPIKFIGGVLAITAKLVLGREGPTIQMGGNIGGMFGEYLRLSQDRTFALIAAGSAAGLAAAFNAPLAGMLFVLEEMREEFHFSFTNYSAVIISCVASVVVLHLMVGTQPAIPMHVFDAPTVQAQSLLLFLVFGIVVGLIGLAFNVVLMKCLLSLDKLSFRAKGVYVIVIAFTIGVLAWLVPDMVGGGYEIIERSLTMQPSFTTLLILIGIRFSLTMLSYSTGVPGGIFAPILALGTLLGLAASYLFQFMIDINVPAGIFAVAGMGALFAAVVRAPVTGIVLVVEMTQNYSLILPLMVTCLTATTVLQLAGNPPIYTQLLFRSLKQTTIEPKDYGMK